MIILQWELSLLPFHEDDPTSECAIFYWVKLKYKPEIHQLLKSKML